MAKRSPERAALAAAIDEKRSRDVERDRLRAVFEAAGEAVRASYSEIAAAERALRDRPQTAAVRMLARAGGGSEEDEPPSTVALRAALAEAESRLADRRAVRDELQKQVDAPMIFDAIGQRVRSAAVAVLAAETGDLVSQAAAKIQGLLIEVARARADIGWLNSAGVFGDLPTEMPAHVSAAMGTDETEAVRLWTAARASSPWATVLDSLMVDADFALPTGK